MILVLKPGETLQVRLFETDGEITIDYDTPEHPGVFQVRETDSLSGNIVGKANAILYKEKFGG